MPSETCVIDWRIRLFPTLRSDRSRLGVSSWTWLNCPLGVWESFKYIAHGCGSSSVAPFCFVFLCLLPSKIHSRALWGHGTLHITRAPKALVDIRHWLKSLNKVLRKTKHDESPRAGVKSGNSRKFQMKVHWSGSTQITRDQGQERQECSKPRLRCCHYLPPG